MELASRVISALRGASAVSLIGQLFSWSVSIVVIRLLTPADYGLYAMAVVVISTLMLINDLGLSGSLVQAPDLDHSTVRRIFGLILLLNILFFAVIFSASPWIAIFFKEDRLKVIIRVLAAQFFIDAFYIIPASRLERDLQFKTKSLVSLPATMLGSLTTLFLAIGGLGVWALVWGNLIGAALRTLGMNFASPPLGWPQFSSGKLDLRRFHSALCVPLPTCGRFSVAPGGPGHAGYESIRRPGHRSGDQLCFLYHL